MYYPPEYKRYLMEILIAHQKTMNEEQKNKGITRNLGWLRICRDIVRFNNPVSPDEALVKKLKSQIEAYQLGRATVADAYFPTIEQYILSLDVAGNLDAVKRALRRERIEYQRKTFNELIGNKIQSNELLTSIDMMDGQIFQFSVDSPQDRHFDTVVLFKKTEVSIMDIQVFVFRDRYSQCVSEKRETGWLFLYGFSSVNKDYRSNDTISISVQSNDIEEDRIAHASITGSALFFNKELAIIFGMECFGFRFTASFFKDIGDLAGIELTAERIDIPSNIKMGEEFVFRDTQRFSTFGKIPFTSPPRTAIHLNDDESREYISHLSNLLT